MLWNVYTRVTHFGFGNSDARRGCCFVGGGNLYSPLPEPPIFSQETNVWHLEISCNSGRIPGPIWRLVSLMCTQFNCVISRFTELLHDTEVSKQNAKWLHEMKCLGLLDQFILMSKVTDCLSIPAYYPFLKTPIRPQYAIFIYFTFALHRIHRIS